MKNPVGQTLRMDSAQYRVIGVVKDFYSHSFFVKMKPTLFIMADEQHYHYLAMKVRPGSMDKTYKSVQARWAVLYPDIPFDGGYQEDVWTGAVECGGKGQGVQHLEGVGRKTPEYCRQCHQTIYYYVDHFPGGTGDSGYPDKKSSCVQSGEWIESRIGMYWFSFICKIN